MCTIKECLRNTSKVILLIVNLLFLLLGLLMLAIGITMVASPEEIVRTVLRVGNAEKYMQLIGDVSSIVRGVGIFMVILGIGMTLVSALGFFGACSESLPLLTLYLVFVIVILLAQIALIVFTLFFPAQFDSEIRKRANATMITDFTQGIQLQKKIAVVDADLNGYVWAALQFGKRCCGTDGPKDYLNERRYPRDKRTMQVFGGFKRTVNYPISCCRLKPGVGLTDISGQDDFVDLVGCLAEYPSPATPGSYNKQDCYSVVKASLKETSRLASWIAIVVIVVQVFIVAFGFILCFVHNGRSRTTSSTANDVT